MVIINLAMTNRMKKTGLAVIICFPVMLFITYIGVKHYHDLSRLAKDDLIWLEGYEVGDTIFFESGTLRDTMIIVDKYIFTQFLYLPSAYYLRFSEFQETGRMYMTLRHSGKNYERNSLNIMKIEESLPCVIWWDMLGLSAGVDPYSWCGLMNDSSADQTGVAISEIRLIGNAPEIPDAVTLTDTVIRGVRFDDCFIGSLNNSQRVNYNYEKSDTLHASEFIWSKRYGLLQYSMENETYIRTDLENLN